jgi:hypothetical protein
MARRRERLLFTARVLLIDNGSYSGTVSRRTKDEAEAEIVSNCRPMAAPANRETTFSAKEKRGGKIPRRVLSRT